MTQACADIEPQLSLLADGLLSAEEETAVRTHLGECAACRGLVADIERLRNAARTLGPITPPDHVWLEVAGAIRLGDAPPPLPVRMRSPRAALWQWAGLSAALVIVTLGLYLFQRPRGTTLPVASNAPVAGSVETVADELNLATEHYERAITELEAMAKNDNGVIDPVLAATFQNNLGAIDQAIAESRAALTSDPESEPARESLFDALRRKISVLQATVSLINEMRVGDQEGAARAADALGKKS